MSVNNNITPRAETMFLPQQEPISPPTAIANRMLTAPAAAAPFQQRQPRLPQNLQLTTPVSHQPAPALQNVVHPLLPPAANLQPAQPAVALNIPQQVAAPAIEVTPILQPPAIPRFQVDPSEEASCFCEDEDLAFCTASRDALYKLVERTSTLGHQVVGIGGSLFVAGTLVGNAVYITLFTRGSKDGREMALGSLDGAWLSTKMAAGTTIKVIGTAIMLFPSCMTSAGCECDPVDSLRECVDLTFKFDPSSAVPVPVPLRENYRRLVVYSPPMALLRELTQTPCPADIENANPLAKKAGLWMEAVEDLEERGRCYAITGAAMRGLHGLKNISVRGVSGSFALADMMYHGLKFIPLRVLGCCSRKYSKKAEVQRLAAKDGGEIFLASTGGILKSTLRDAPAYVMSSCCPDSMETCTKSCDDAAYGAYLKTCKSRKKVSGQNVERQKQIEDMRKEIYHSPWRRFLQWMSGAESFNAGLATYTSSRAAPSNNLA